MSDRLGGAAFGLSSLSTRTGAVMAVRLEKARARQVLRPLHKWRRVAERHGLLLSRSDFTSYEGGLCVDSMPAAEWIMAVCGCGEDDGTLAQHVGPKWGLLR